MNVCMHSDKVEEIMNMCIHTYIHIYVQGSEQADAGEANMKKSLFSTAFHSALNEHVLEEEQKKITTYEGMCICVCVCVCVCVFVVHII